MQMLEKVVLATLALLITSCVSTGAGQRSKIHEVETNVRVPVLIKNLPPKKHSLVERMKYFETPGLSVAVIEHGKNAWSKGYGLRENGGEEKIDSETVFQAASMSKPVAALGVLSLVNDGRIKLDDDVNLHLRSWQVPENSFTKDDKVTIRRLLSHTAGLTDGNGFPGYQPGTQIPTLLEILNGSANVNSSPIIVGMKPGAFFQYSGGGYEILQLLVEDVTGKPFAQFMEDTIFVPLEMTHSSFLYPLPKSLAKNAASAHNRNEVVKGKWHIYPEKAAAALWTTPSDMAKMIIAVHRCARGMGEQQGLSKVLGQKLCQEMLAMHEWPTKNGHAKKMGLGFMVDEMAGRIMFHHSGGNEGITCNFRGTSVQDNLHGTIIMTNSSRGRHVIEELEKTIDDVYGWKKYQPIEKEMADIKIEMLRRRVGSRYSDHRLTVFVIERDGHLALVDSRDVPPQPIDIFPERENLFFDLEGGMHQFSPEEYIWTPPGGNESRKFQKI